MKQMQNSYRAASQNTGFTNIMSADKEVCYWNLKFFFNYPSCLAEVNKIIIFGIFQHLTWKIQHSRFNAAFRTNWRQSSCLDWKMWVIQRFTLTPELWQCGRGLKWCPRYNVCRSESVWFPSVKHNEVTDCWNCAHITGSFRCCRTYDRFRIFRIKLNIINSTEQRLWNFPQLLQPVTK